MFCWLALGVLLYCWVVVVLGYWFVIVLLFSVGFCFWFVTYACCCLFNALVWVYCCGRWFFAVCGLCYEV